MTDQNQVMDASDMSLADLAGVDVSGIEEVRFETMPIGTFRFRVKEASIDEGFNKDNEKCFKPQFELEVIETISILKTPQGEDKAEYADKQVGRKHTERFNINMAKDNEEIAKAIGRVKAFHTDIGGESWGSNLIENCESTVDLEFVGNITHQQDPNDKSRQFARLNVPKKKG